MGEIEWPWQYSFPPFFTIQPHEETRLKQMTAWRKLILEYFKVNHSTTLDVQEIQQSKLFSNQEIKRELSQDAVLTVLEELEKSGDAAPWDKSKSRWDIYWRSLEEWGSLVYTWASNNGMNNTVCTIHELIEGDNTTDEDFHGLESAFIMKALRVLEAKKKCEVIDDEECQGVKFF